MESATGRCASTSEIVAPSWCRSMRPAGTFAYIFSRVIKIGAGFIHPFDSRVLHMILDVPPDKDETICAILTDAIAVRLLLP